MKTFREMRDQDFGNDYWDEDDLLEEGLMRTGISAGFAAKAKSHGNNAEKFFTSAATQTKTAKNANVDTKLDAALASLALMAQGMIQLRLQAGANTAMIFALATLNARSDEELKKLVKGGNQHGRR